MRCEPWCSEILPLKTRDCLLLVYKLSCNTHALLLLNPSVLGVISHSLIFLPQINLLHVAAWLCFPGILLRRCHDIINRDVFVNGNKNDIENEIEI